ncbi:hypothetical protein B0H21DRAFT_781812 [Amylocystis lapponica]|nr:hypothetical protein B0H21DRAFT_781812 [Amylocystis lapponica]
MHHLPPGEEVIFFSHARGEEELCREMLEAGQKRKDTRTRRGCTEARNKDWLEQHEDLVEVYIAWKASIPLVGVPEDNELPSFEMYTLVPANKKFIVDIIRCTPMVMETYRQLHRVCPQLSVQAQVHALCHLHSVPFRKTLAEQFSIVYDVYLDILHAVDNRVNVVLRRDTPNWCMLNVCVPYMWISPDNVDCFKDEVVQAHNVPNDLRFLTVSAIQSGPVAVCVERWQNAGPEVCKKMFALFAVTGIFICLCHHGHLLIMCDMVHSEDVEA